jgi:hypothetical protein
MDILASWFINTTAPVVLCLMVYQLVKMLKTPGSSGFSRLYTALI